MATPIVTFCGTCKLIKISCTPCACVCVCSQIELYSHWKIAVLGGSGAGACNCIPCGVTYGGACMNQITRSDSGANWFTDGFRLCGSVTLACSETPANNGTYTISVITSTVLTLSAACLTNTGADCAVQFAMDGNLGAGFLPAFSPSGGDPIGGGQSISAYFFLQNGWRILPVCVPCACKSYFVCGNLFVCGCCMCGGSHPFTNTALSLNTFVSVCTASKSITTTVCVGSAVTPCDIAAIAGAVWDEPVTSHTTAGSVGKIFNEIYKKTKTAVTMLFTK